MSLVTYFTAVGLWVQENEVGEAFRTNTFAALVVVFFTVFYPVAIYFVFQAYREFKGMLFDSGMGGG